MEHIFNFIEGERICSVISSLNGKHLKLVDPFMYFGSNISFTESNVKIHVSNGLL